MKNNFYIDSESNDYSNDYSINYRNNISSNNNINNISSNNNINNTNDNLFDILEICYQKDEFFDILKNSTVLFVSGDTGCGKSTQIPKFLHEYYSNRLEYLIGVTQPRRIAAVSISNRINDEIHNTNNNVNNTNNKLYNTNSNTNTNTNNILYNTNINKSYNTAAYHIMYENTTRKETRIKIMTEGILLKEIYGDPLIHKYNCIVLDEVHERSINFDLLVLFLSQIVKKRKQANNEFKVILMSATMNTAFFENLFEDVKIGHFVVKSKKHKVSVFYEGVTPKNVNEAVFSKIMKIIECERGLDNPQEYFLENDKDLCLEEFFESCESDSCESNNSNKIKNIKNIKNINNINNINNVSIYNKNINNYNKIDNYNNITNYNKIDNVNNNTGYKCPNGKNIMEKNVKEKIKIKEELNKNTNNQNKESDDSKKIKYDVSNSNNIASCNILNQDEYILQKANEMTKNDFYKNKSQKNNLHNVYKSNSHKNKIHKSCRSILVFLPSKKDIYYLRNKLEVEGVGMKVLPLHSGMSKDEQDRIFEPGKKIILSTNIAETSITVPGVFYVIDSGKIKMKYLYNTTITYKEEYISKHSAIQRTGRAGRVAPGVCFRMYSGARYETFREETPPESARETPEEVLFSLHNFIRGTRNKIVKVSQKVFGYTEEALSLAYWSLGQNNLLIVDEKTDVVTITDPSLFSLPLDSFLARCFSCAKSINCSENIYKMVVVGICMLQMGLEIPYGASDWKHDFIRSDFIRNIWIFHSYRKHGLGWCMTNDLNYNCLVQIEKLAKKLLREDPFFIYDEADAEEHNKIIASFFGRNVAKFVKENEFEFDNKTVYLDTLSVVSNYKEKMKYVVFQYIQITKSDKMILKNISVVEEADCEQIDCKS